MNPDDDKKKKKNKDWSDDDFNPFDFFEGFGEFDMNKFMDNLAPFFKGSSFGKMIDEMIKNLMKNIEEGDLDSGSLKDMLNNNFVYGFNIGLDPEGKPSFRQFGNLKPKGFGDLETSDVREPLIDVFKEDTQVRVVAEVPGISKGDIKLTGTDRTLTIKAHSQSRKYEKSVSLPVSVDIKTAKAKYKNGVLEVIIERKQKETEEDYNIDVD